MWVEPFSRTKKRKAQLLGLRCVSTRWLRAFDAARSFGARDGPGLAWRTAVGRAPQPEAAGSTAELQGKRRGSNHPWSNDLPEFLRNQIYGLGMAWGPFCSKMEML